MDFQDAFPDTQPCFYRFVVLVDSEERRIRAEGDLEARGIETKSPVFEPLHRYLGLDPAAFAGTESVQARALSLPIYPSLTDEEQDRVVEALTESLT